MILDVARDDQFVGVIFSFKFTEKIAWRFTQNIYQYIKTATVGHPQNKLLDAVGATALDNLLQRRDQAFAALQRKAFLSHIFGVQVTFDTFSRRNVLEQLPPCVGRVSGRPVAEGGFDSGLQPSPFPCVSDVVVLRADRSAIDSLYRGNDVSQPHSGSNRKRTGIELLGHVSLGQPVKIRLQIGNVISC